MFVVYSLSEGNKKTRPANGVGAPWADLEYIMRNQTFGDVIGHIADSYGDIITY